MRSYPRFKYDGSIGAVANSLSPIAYDSLNDIVFTSCNELLGCWSVRDSTCQKKLSVPFDTAEDLARFSQITCIASIPTKNESVIAGYDDGTIRIWNHKESQIKTAFHGHKKAIRAFTISLDGRLLASTDLSKEIVIWDIENGEGKFRLTIPEAEANCLSFIYPGENSNEGDQSRETPILRSRSPVVARASISASGCSPVLRFSCDPVFLVAGCSDGFIRIWDLETHEMISVTSTQSLAAIHSLLILPDQSNLIIGTGTSHVEIYDLEESSFSGPQKKVTIKFSGKLERPESKKRITSILCLAWNDIAEGNSGGWSTGGSGCAGARGGRATSYVGSTSGGPITLLPDGRRLDLNSWSFSPSDNLVILLLSGNSKIEILLSFNSKNRSKRESRVLHRRLQRLKKRIDRKLDSQNTTQELTDLLGKNWANFLSDDTIRTGAQNSDSAKAKTPPAAKSLAELEAAVERLTEYLKSKSRKRTLKEIDEVELAEDEGDLLSSSKCSIRFKMLNEKLELTGKALHGVAGSSNIVIFSTTQNQLERYIFDLSEFFRSLEDEEGGQRELLLTTRVTLTRSILGTTEGLEDVPTQLAVSNSGTKFLCLTATGVSLWQDRQCRLRIDKAMKIWKKDVRPTAAFFCAGDRMTVVGDSAGGLTLIDCQTAEKIFSHTPLQKSAVTAMCQSPDHLAFYTINSKDRSITKWNFEAADADGHEGAETSRDPASRVRFMEVEMGELPDKPQCVSISPDGRHISVGLLNHTIVLLYSDSLKIRTILYGHSLPVTCLGFSGDSSRLASGSLDRHVKVWDVKFGNVLKSLPIGRGEGHVSCLDYVEDEEQIILLGTTDGNLQMWDTSSGERVTTMRAGRAPIRSLALAKDEALVGSGDMTVKVWIKTDEPIFIHDEREREFALSDSLHLARSDVALPLAGQRDVTMTSRPTVKDSSSIKSVEKLMRVLDEYQDTNSASASWKILNLTPHQYLINQLTQIPSELISEVIIALPYPLAKLILQECATAISNVYNQLVGRSGEKERKGDDVGAGKSSGGGSGKRVSAPDEVSTLSVLMISQLETIIKVALCIVHVHREYIWSDEAAATSERMSVQSLAKEVNWLIKSQLDFMRANFTILSII